MSRFRPLFVALVVAALLSVLLFLLSGQSMGTGVEAYGPAAAPWWVMTREEIAGGSTVSARPGLGLVLAWVGAVAYGLFQSLRRP